MAKSPAFVVFLSFLLLVGVVIAGCGGNMTGMPSSSARQMVSLMVTPASADAQASPGGQVQFMATATFNMAPMTVASPQVMWSIGNPFPTPTPMMMSGKMATSSMTPTPTVSPTGMARCNGFMGMVTIQATAPADPAMSISQMSGMTSNVVGMAQMTCP